MKEKSCGVVVFRRQGNEIHYLLLQYASGHWDYVKGHVEEGEEEQSTAIREAEEETGINDLKFIEGFREQISYFYKREGKTIFKEVVFFIAETKMKDVKLSHEHKGHLWLNYEEALKQVTYKNARDTLQKADVFLKNNLNSS